MSYPTESVAKRPDTSGLASIGR